MGEDRRVGKHNMTFISISTHHTLLGPHCLTLHLPVPEHPEWAPKVRLSLAQRLGVLECDSVRTQMRVWVVEMKVIDCFPPSSWSSHQALGNISKRLDVAKDCLLIPHPGAWKLMFPGLITNYR